MVKLALWTSLTEQTEIMNQELTLHAATFDYDRSLPLSLYPTAAQNRVTDGQLADFFMLDIRFVRAMNSFTKDLLISRAIEGGYVKPGWTPKSSDFPRLLEELSRMIMGHWSILLTSTEREERRHVLFVIRVMRRTFNPFITKESPWHTNS